MGFKYVTSYTCWCKGNPKGRSAAGAAARPWPKNQVVYKLDPRFPKDFKAAFKKAAKIIERNTCVRFRKVSRRFRSRNVVSISQGPMRRVVPCGFGYGSGGYVDGLGAASTHMVLDTETKCNVARSRDFIGLIVHEMLHVLGFEHTQKRPDR